MISRDTSRTPAKPKMELSATKNNEKLLTFIAESPTLDSTGVLDTPSDVLKNINYYKN